MARRGLILLLILSVVLCACGSGSEKEQQPSAGETVTAQTEEQEIQLLTVGQEGLPLRYAQAFAASLKNQYEGAFGENIWQVEYREASFEGTLRDAFRTHIALFFASYCLAVDRNTATNAEEEKLLTQAASAYLERLDAADEELLGLSLSDTQELLRMFLLAKKAYEEVAGSVELDLSEDETRVIRLQEIRIRTEGLSDAEIDQKLTLAAEALTQLEAGEDFETVAQKYSETPTAAYTASRDSLSSAEVRVVFDLATDEISPVVTLPGAYVIYRCVDSYDKEASATNRMELLKQAEDNGFKERLSQYLTDHPLTWNESAWSSLRIADYAGPAKASLYAVFEEFFGED